MASRLEQAPKPAVKVPSPSAPPSEPEVVEEAPATASDLSAAEGAEIAEEGKDNRGVIRNQEGVIVGIKTKQQGPNITGFIKLEPRKSARQQVIITEAKKGPGGGRASARKKREERAQRMSRNRPQRRDRFRSGPPQINTVEMSEAKRRIRVDEVIQVSDLAHQMGQKAAKIVRELWGLGLRGITINNAVDLETAELVAERFGYTVDNVAFNEEEIVVDEANDDEDLRPPVVTVMGHVDHGKTSLLDYIRSADVADGEAGGITQHIGAYRVATAHGDVVFLDTPGHEAFSSMRSRGVQITDIVVLIVAADDGVMPTTIEAIEHAKKSGTPIIVAINKCDKPEANPGRVKQMFMEHGIVGAEFGGDTEMVEISAKTGAGVDNMLELLALQAEVMDLRAPTDGRGGGVVIEARMDKGRGPVATVLVERGTLSRSDVAVANEFSGKVRGMYDDRGQAISEVGPGTPVEVLGLDGVPSAGDRFDVVENERAAKQLVSHRREKRRRKESVRAGPSVHDLIAKRRIPSVKIVLRADVQGSAEALKESLEALSTEKVRVEVIFTGVGAINENDVKFASAGEAVIIGFNSKPVGKAATQADSVGVEVLQFSIIYEATERVTELMIDQLDPVFKENDIGEAEVRQIFSIPKLGVVAGCRVLRGRVTRASHVRVKRGGEVVYEGEVESLRSFKDDVKEVGEGHECGIVIANFPGVEAEDIIEAYELEKLRATL
jgi:translation initiation factor IF-2